jgi:hypothetical protein
MVIIPFHFPFLLLLSISFFLILFFLIVFFSLSLFSFPFSPPQFSSTRSPAQTCPPAAGHLQACRPLVVLSGSCASVIVQLHHACRPSLPPPHPSASSTSFPSLGRLHLLPPAPPSLSSCAPAPLSSPSTFTTLHCGRPYVRLHLRVPRARDDV